MRAIDREQVRELLGRGAQLVEVLAPEEYEQEHLPGAINIPLRELDARHSELRRDVPVILYCYDYA